MTSKTYKLITVVPVFYRYSNNKDIAKFEDVTSLLKGEVYPLDGVSSQKTLILILIKEIAVW